MQPISTFFSDFQWFSPFFIDEMPNNFLHRQWRNYETHLGLLKEALGKVLKRYPVD